MLNTTDLSISFHGQTSLKDTIFSVLVSGVKLFVVGWRNGLMDSYIFSIWYKRIYFSLPLNLAIHRMDNASNILCLSCKEQESRSYFIFYCKLSTLRLHQCNILPTLRSEILLLNWAQKNLCEGLDLPFKQ